MSGPGCFTCVSSDMVKNSDVESLQAGSSQHSGLRQQSWSPDTGASRLVTPHPWWRTPGPFRCAFSGDPQCLQENGLGIILAFPIVVRAQTCFPACGPSRKLVSQSRSGIHVCLAPFLQRLQILRTDASVLENTTLQKLNADGQWGLMARAGQPMRQAEIPWRMDLSWNESNPRALLVRPALLPIHMQSRHLAGRQRQSVHRRVPHLLHRRLQKEKLRARHLEQHRQLRSGRKARNCRQGTSTHFSWGQETTVSWFGRHLSGAHGGSSARRMTRN